MITRRMQHVAEGVAHRLPAVLAKRRLKPAVSGYALTEINGIILMIARLSPAHIEAIEPYMADDLLEQMRHEIGHPVYAVRKSGLGYVVLLSNLPKLPRQVHYPVDTPTGTAALGQSAGGGMIALSWKDLGHLLVAGQTGSGKSAFLRLLVYQALRDGMSLLLADIDQATFPMLVDHPALLAPIAVTPTDALTLIDQALEECDRRAALYRQVDGFPDHVEEYNRRAVEEGVETLARVLVVLDEFSATASAEPQIKAKIAQLGWRGRKFGVQVVFAAQEFTKEVVGAVREQVNTAVCFRVRSGEMARRVHCAGAENLSRPGLAITDRWGMMQACWIDKGMLGSVKLALSDEDLRVAEIAAARSGHISIPVLVGRGWSEWRARKLLETWEARGWVVREGTTRRITTKLAEMLSNAQSPQTTSILSKEK